jgi:hypothetical protein
MVAAVLEQPKATVRGWIRGENNDAGADHPPEQPDH